MDEAIRNFVANASVYQKGFFLMAVGIGFVFTVQLVFYLAVKLWLRKPGKDRP